MPILDDAELRKITKRTYAPAQARQLRALGIPYEIRLDGSILVYRWAVEPQQRVAKKVAPRFDLVR